MFSPKVTHPFNKGEFGRINASVVRASEKMFNYDLYKVDYKLSNELKVAYVILKPPEKGGSERLIRCFTSKTDIVSMKLCYQGFFVLKILHKVYILFPWCPHRVGQKSNFVHDLVNNTGR